MNINSANSEEERRRIFNAKVQHKIEDVKRNMPRIAIVALGAVAGWITSFAPFPVPQNQDRFVMENTGGNSNLVEAYEEAKLLQGPGLTGTEINNSITAKLLNSTGAQTDEQRIKGELELKAVEDKHVETSGEELTKEEIEGLSRDGGIELARQELTKLFKNLTSGQPDGTLEKLEPSDFVGREVEAILGDYLPDLAKELAKKFGKLEDGAEDKIINHLSESDINSIRLLFIGLGGFYALTSYISLLVVDPSTGRTLAEQILRRLKNPQFHFVDTEALRQIPLAVPENGELGSKSNVPAVAKTHVANYQVPQTASENGNGKPVLEPNKSAFSPMVPVFIPEPKSALERFKERFTSKKPAEKMNKVPSQESELSYKKDVKTLVEKIVKWSNEFKIPINIDGEILKTQLEKHLLITRPKLSMLTNYISSLNNMSDTECKTAIKNLINVCSMPEPRNRNGR